jgi:hypothetical protein
MNDGDQFLERVVIAVPIAHEQSRHLVHGRVGHGTSAIWLELPSFYVFGGIHNSLKRDVF